jgi:hypothetical protein
MHSYPSGDSTVERAEGKIVYGSQDEMIKNPGASYQPGNFRKRKRLLISEQENRCVNQERNQFQLENEGLGAGTNNSLSGIKKKQFSL